MPLLPSFALTGAARRASRCAVLWPRVVGALAGVAAAACASRAHAQYVAAVAPPSLRAAVTPVSTVGAANDPATLPAVAEAQVERWVRYFAGPEREALERAVARAQPWAPMIAEKLGRAGLPGALIYLPVIESSYSPWARSRAGAVGMWQFMPGTARAFGLTINDWLDERRDPELATDAAVRYLADLYRTLGDWPLALAGYNAGDGRVTRAVRATDARTRGAHAFWTAQRAMPSETRAYVPKLLAVYRIGSNPAGYGLRLRTPAPWPPLVKLALPPGTRLDVVAAVWGITLEQLATWNPAIRRQATPPNREYVVRLPADDAEAKRDRLFSLPTSQWRLPARPTRTAR